MISAAAMEAAGDVGKKNEGDEEEATFGERTPNVTLWWQSDQSNCFIASLKYHSLNGTLLVVPSLGLFHVPSFNICVGLTVFAAN